MAARRALNLDEQRAREWGARHAMPEHVDPKACSVCGATGCAAGYGAPGILGLRQAPSVWRCVEHRPERGFALPDGIGVPA